MFYRGGWCPYCNAHLGELSSISDDLRQLGYDLFFLSADRPEILYSSLKDPEHPFVLLSDARMTASRAYGIAFRVDDATFTRYQSMGLDLEAASGETHHELPVPAQRDLDFQFGVNVFGVHRVTRAFLPLIIESKGRITTIGSISGYIAEENASTYSMAKFAMEAFTDSLALEMEPLGVTVSIVEPGSFRTSIWRKMADRQLEQAEITLQTALRRVAELNHAHKFSYSRDSLVEMLDEALAALEKPSASRDKR